MAYTDGAIQHGVVAGERTKNTAGESTGAARV